MRFCSVSRRFSPPLLGLLLLPEAAVFGAAPSAEHSSRFACQMSFSRYEEVEDDRCSDPTQLFGDGISAEDWGVLKRLVDLRHEVSWRDCCRRHDFFYWLGGSKQLQQLAENDLSRCIASSISVQGEGVGRLMSRIVRKAIEWKGRTMSWATEKNTQLHRWSGFQLVKGRHGNRSDHLWGAAWGEKYPFDEGDPEKLRCLLRNNTVRREICVRAVMGFPAWPCRNQAICRNPGAGLDPRAGARTPLVRNICSGARSSETQLDGASFYLPRRKDR